MKFINNIILVLFAVVATGFLAWNYYTPQIERLKVENKELTEQKYSYGEVIDSLSCIDTITVRDTFTRFVHYTPKKLLDSIEWLNNLALDLDGNLEIQKGEYEEITTELNRKYEELNRKYKDVLSNTETLEAEINYWKAPRIFSTDQFIIESCFDSTFIYSIPTIEKPYKTLLYSGITL